MGKVSKKDVETAERQAAACKEAAEQIEQAGRGLALVMDACVASTAGTKELAILAAVQAYTADALRVLLEKDLEQEKASSLVVPGGGLIKL